MAAASSANILVTKPALWKAVSMKSWDVSSGRTRNAERELFWKPKTAKAKPAPCVLHWMASGVVDQMRMMPR